MAVIFKSGLYLLLHLVEVVGDKWFISLYLVLLIIVRGFLREGDDNQAMNGCVKLESVIGKRGVW